MIDLAKKATMATVKAFIKNNRDALLIDCESSFDGMVDGVRGCANRGFTKALPAEMSSHTFGVHGAWFVGSSRDYITPFRKDGVEGYRIYNCCGSFNLAIPLATEAA